MRKLLSICACSAGLASTQIACAYDLPALNLGLTSFMDGGLPAGGGWYVQQYLQNYSASHLRDKDGNDLGLPRHELDYQLALTQLSYLSDLRVGNASLGLNMLVPIIAHIDVDDGLDNAALKARSGVGDLLIGPFIQFDPIMGPDGPRFVHRIELQVNLPTGEYDRDRDINPGNNAWSFNPYWAATYWFTPKWTASLRAHYLYNGKNNAPVRALGDLDDMQAGQALHANFTTEYAVTEHLRLGLNGYWLKQLSDTRFDGHEVSGRREKVWAIGPGAMYSFSPDDHLFFNAYFEQDAENRPEGTRVQARYVHHF